MADAFRPTIYLKRECPFCLKTMIFLTEGGLIEQFEIKAFAAEGNDPAEAAIREELTPHFEKVSFPTVQTAPGEYLNESDAIIAHYEPQSSKKASEMILLPYYLDGVMKSVGRMYRELNELKKANA